METFQIFSGKRLDDVLRAIIASAKQAVETEAADYLMNVNEEAYISHLKDRFSLDPLVLHLDRVQASSEERYVEPRERFASMEPGTKYRKQVITYHLPFSGDAGLLRFQPNPGLVWSMAIYVHDDAICFEVIDYTGVADDIKRTADRQLGTIRTQWEHQAKQVNAFNASLEATVRQMVGERKKELMSKRSVLDQLGVPIRKSKNVPATFTVPDVRKKVFSKPPASATVKVFTPTLAPTIYNEILQTIFDMGKTFERLPSTYADKDEPTLRDFLILQLEPRFEGSTTGETFNKAGKTDILIRYEKANIFVAECKFWEGKAQHFKTIDQLLSYLTWRDSKTAIVNFVKRKEIVPILNEITGNTPQHPCYVRTIETKEQGSWQVFEFSLPNDPDCKITLTILSFHLPPLK